MRRFLLILVFLSFEAFALNLTQSAPEKSTENGYVEPFQMFDDVYYVGDKWASSYLIKTSEGLVLIDSLDSPFGQWIPGNVRMLGLNPEDIKYIFITHGHSDHVGGAEFLQRMYGSKVIISYEDFLLAKEQSKGSKGKGFFKAPKVERFTGDGAELSVGDSTFKFYLTPGHTKGCLSIDFLVKDRGRKHRAFIVGGNGTNFEGLEQAEMYVESVARIEEISRQAPSVEVNLANHPEMNQLFERKNQDIQEPNPYIDAKGFAEFLAVLEARGAKKLLEERTKKRRIKLSN